MALVLGAPVVLPGVIESRYAKLLSGEREQLVGWQHGYAFKSLLATTHVESPEQRKWLTGAAPLGGS